MPNRKKFNIHDLYPSDYYFDWDAFEKDPEGYEFTEADIAYSNAMDLERFEDEVKMTPYEKRVVRRWVMDGHSPYENPGSKYLCMTGSEPYDFLTVYRLDRELEQEMKGMKKSQKISYLKELMGWTDEDKPEEVSEESDWLPVDPDNDNPFGLI